MSYDRLIHPQPEISRAQPLGFYPVDFYLESIIEAGIEKFRADSAMANTVFGHLLQIPKYGQTKIDEIYNYINSVKIHVIQGFPVSQEISPSISINLNDGFEEERYAGLDNFESDRDVLGYDDSVVGRTEIGYAPFKDSLLIGIHAIGGSDKVKYLYYLVGYILVANKEQLEDLGLCLSTFRATDLSRLNEFLPQDMFSRFITFSALTTVKFKKADAPIIDEFTLNVETDDEGV